MKRNWDLIRELMLVYKFEPMSGIEKLSDKYTERVVLRHIELIKEAGLLGNKGLTWAGHELLASIQTMGSWKSTKDVALQHSLPLTLHSIKAIAKHFLKVLK